MQLGVIRTGKPCLGNEVRGVTPAEPDRERVWIVDYYPVRQDGDVLAVGCCVQEVTEQKQGARALEEAAVRQDVLFSELQHRVKNTMATVLAILQLSARSATNMDKLSSTLRKRLEVISRTHDFLTTSGWEGSTIEEVARREIEPYTESLSGQLVYRGDDILLPAKQMLSLSLAIHELATNAVKYGALSTSSGRIVIDADNSDGRIELSWHEEGGPEVVPPEDGDTVFGSLLLSRILGPDLHGQADLRYEVGDIVYSLAFPAANQKQHNPEPLK